MSLSEETTLVSDCGQDGRTDADIPTDYASVRVTCSHVDIRRMLEKIFQNYDYICYPHKGSKTGKEHCHVLIPNCDVKSRDLIKARLNRNGYIGNQTFSIKGMHNGLLCGIQYASKEGTTPVVCGDLQKFIDMAPQWSHQTSIHNHFVPKTVDPKSLRDWQLTYSNLVCQATHYAKVNRLGTMTLKEVVHDMIKKTRWRPSKQLLCGGVPDFYSDDFQYRMGHKSDVSMEWFHTRNF